MYCVRNTTSRASAFTITTYRCKSRVIQGAQTSFDNTAHDKSEEDVETCQHCLQLCKADDYASKVQDSTVHL